MKTFAKLIVGCAVVATFTFIYRPAGPLTLVERGTKPPFRAVAVPLLPNPAGGAASAATASIDQPFGSVRPVEAVAPTAGSAMPQPDLQLFQSAAELYRKGQYIAADAIAARISDSAQRAGLEWLAVKAAPAPDGARLATFAHDHPGWPDGGWIEAVQESSLYSRHATSNEIDAAFADRGPATAPGVLAYARAALAQGRMGDAQDAVVKLWRDRDLDSATENAVLREFGGFIGHADHKYRAERLLYEERGPAALRAAALAGSDVVALANVRLQAAVGPIAPRSMAAIPMALQSEPSLLFARIQDARRSNRAAEATDLFEQSPRDAGNLVDPEKWWSERRMVAREWLDKGEYLKAYKLCADAVVTSSPAAVDASFHAGWIALRFLADPVRAARHFDGAIAAALTPLSIARAYYWRGRAAEAMGESDDAHVFFSNAAAYPIAFYGQLAARRLGLTEPAGPRSPVKIAQDDQRWLATRVVEKYYESGFEEFANGLAYAAAGVWRDEAQIAALGAVIAAHASPSVAVTFGKLATERGYALDQIAFPLNGAPAFAPLSRSADEASVLGVVRQESEFIWRAASGAGAKGLMQVLPTTAQYAARRAGIGFDYGRLVADPAYNLQVGAAYLGQMIDDEGGSVEMALAAYNAGAGRVAQWISAFGDPRTGAIDTVDWIERIPFDETRDYVERVSENIAVYRARLGQSDSSSGAKLAAQQ